MFFPKSACLKTAHIQRIPLPLPKYTLKIEVAVKVCKQDGSMEKESGVPRGQKEGNQGQAGPLWEQKFT